MDSAAIKILEGRAFVSAWKNNNHAFLVSDKGEIFSVGPSYAEDCLDEVYLEGVSGDLQDTPVQKALLYYNHAVGSQQERFYCMFGGVVLCFLATYKDDYDIVVKEISELPEGLRPLGQ